MHYLLKLYFYYHHLPTHYLLKLYYHRHHLPMH